MEKESKKCCCGNKPKIEMSDEMKSEIKKVLDECEPAAKLINSGEEIFAQFSKQKITTWTKASWELHKSVINETFDLGWENVQHPWNRSMQYFWRFTIAFSSYGMVSLAITDPSYYDEACDIMRKSVLLMRDAGAQDNWVRLGWSKDPLTTKNVMYKGHLNLMYGLYQLMTGSTEFEEEHLRLTKMMITEVKNNLKTKGFWGIECEDDQYFPPCNSIGLLSYKAYDLIHRKNYAQEFSYPTAKYIEEKMTDKRTGINYFRYHPSHDYVEPYIIGDGWATSSLHYFNPEITEKAADSIRREFLVEIKDGQECYLKATLDSNEPSTDYEQQLWILYVPLMYREIPDIITWEKVNRFLISVNGIKMQNGKLRFTKIEPWYETLIEGYLFLGNVHLGWKQIFDFDWTSFRNRMKN